jgi:hypothetical protein
MVGSAFALLGLFAYAPYLTSGFAADDFIFISMLEGATPYDPWLGFWSVPVDQCQGFTQLWWAATPSSGAFLRPVPSWTLTALFEWFGRNAAPFHVTSAIIHSLVAFTAFLLLRRLSGRDPPALLAALLFLVCEDHAMTVAWVATITDLLCALFLNLAMLCHIAGREDRKPWLFASSLLFFLIAFASKETAAVYPVIVALYEFLFARRLAGEQRPLGLKARATHMLVSWWAWLPPLLVFAAYMAFYRSLLPPLATMTYVDPVTQPGRYLAAAVPGLPVMFLGLLSQFLPSIILMVPGTELVSVGSGLALTGLLILALLPYRSEPAIWFSLATFTLALLPGLATEPGERLLYYPSVFGFFPLAWLILHIPALKRRLMPNSPAGVRVLGSAWGWYLLVSALLLPVVLLFVYPSMWIPSMKWPERTVVDSLPLIDDDVHEHAVYLNTNSSFNTFYLPDIYRYHRGDYIDLRVLSSFNGRVEARAEFPDAIILRTRDGGWLSNPFASIPRGDPKLDVGDEFVTETFTATILEVTATERDALEVRFDFELPLDGLSTVLIFWDGESYRRWQPAEAWQMLNTSVDRFSF